MGFSWGSRVFLLWSYLRVERLLIWRECFWVINKYSFLCLECARHCSWPGIPLLPNCYFKDKHALKALGLSLSQVQTWTVPSSESLSYFLPLHTFRKLQIPHRALALSGTLARWVTKNPIISIVNFFFLSLFHRYIKTSFLKNFLTSRAINKHFMSLFIVVVP